MKLKCFFGLHEWKYRKPIAITFSTDRKCIQCGKEQKSVYNVELEKAIWHNVKWPVSEN